MSIYPLTPLDYELLHKQIEEAEANLENCRQKYRMKTLEINILVNENRALLAKVDEYQKAIKRFMSGQYTPNAGDIKEDEL